MESDKVELGPALIVALVFGHYLAQYLGNFSHNPVPFIINGPVWTLSWEIFCYVLIGLIWWIGLLTSPAFSSSVFSAALLFIVTQKSGDTILIVAPLLLFFSLGGFIAINESRLNLFISGPICLGLLLLIISDPDAIIASWIINFIPFLYGPNYGAKQYYYFLYLFCLPFSLVWIALYVKPIFRLQSDYSYGLYIYGWPIQQAIIASLNPGPVVLFSISLLVTHALAMISWHVIEKPALKLKI